MFSAVVNLQFVTFLFTDFVVVVWEIFGLVCQQFCLKMSVDTEETHQVSVSVCFTVWLILANTKGRCESYYTGPL